MKITLGTVQFGLDYGVTNNKGKPSIDEIKKILTLAKSKDIHQLDTAPSYGNAEERLGNLNIHGFSIYTKTPHFQNNVIFPSDIERLIEVFNHSLKQLGVSEVEGLLIHNVQDCYKENSELLFVMLQKLKQKNKVKKIGVSVYEPKDIEMILANNIKIDMIQLPLNILDQRVLQSNLLQKLKDRKIEVHVRSIFLQGKLLSDESMILPEEYDYMGGYFEDLKTYGLTKLEAALLFIKQIKEIDYVLLGVNSFAHFKEIVDAFEKVKTWNQHIDFSTYACKEVSIIDPRRW